MLVKEARIMQESQHEEGFDSGMARRFPKIRNSFNYGERQLFDDMNDESSGKSRLKVDASRPRMRPISCPAWLALTVLLLCPSVLLAQYTLVYSTNGSVITVTGYTGTPVAVTIPNFVIAVGNSAFSGCSSLRSINLPGNLASIGAFAFSDTGITNITIPNSVTNIGQEAFDGCNTLANVVISTNLTSIGISVFAWCGLTNVVIPNSITSIGEYAFNYCALLTSITIPASVTNIGEFAFDGCTSLNSLVIDNTGTEIDPYAFENCPSLTSLTIAEGNTAIGNGDFSGINTLTNVVIAGSVTNIGFDAFNGCQNLACLTIGNGSAAIAQSAFENCPHLSTLIIGNSSAVIADNEFENLELYATNVIIQNGVTSIGSDALSTLLMASVTIPGTVTNLGREAFDICQHLTSVLFTGNAPAGDSSVFYGDSATVYYLPGTTGWSSNFCNLPTMLWNPSIQTTVNFGGLSNQFGFTVTGTAGIPVTVEACANLAGGTWTVMQSCTVTNGSVYFTDPTWTNYPSRFYSIVFP
jgi:hypothetical protein